jgi:uncharacterized repeat protein (TIGR01451 family)
MSRSVSFAFAAAAGAFAAPAGAAARRRPPRRRTALLTSLVLLVVLAPAAAANRDFSVRFAANTQGNVTLAGNSLMTCPASAACTTALGGSGTLNNNNWDMVRVDRDQDASTSNSSSAQLTLPSNTEVLFAALYYGGRDASRSPERTRVKFAARPGSSTCSTPALPSYQTFTNGLVDEAVDVSGDVRMYQGFVDVTPTVQAVGTGCYTVGGIPLTTDTSDPRRSDHSGGWALAVAYKDAAAPPRNLTIFDGMQFVTTKAEQGEPVDIELKGFQTPPLGTVNTSVGFVAYEGDLGNTGDFAQLDGETLFDALNPKTNFFNSSLAIFGKRLTLRDPDPVNQLGYDADIVAAPANTLTNDQTRTTIHLDTDGDGYAPGAVFFATDLYAPKLESTKTVSPAGPAKAGDRLTYTISVKNTGLDAATNVVLADRLPSGTTFVPGSLVSTVPGQNEYDSANRQVVFRLGQLAAQAVDWQATVSFAVTVNDGLPQGTQLTNVGTIGYTAETLDTPGEVDTPPATTPVQVPDLAIRKTHLSDFAAGRTTTFRLTVSNVGPVPSRGTVTVSDTLKPQFAFAGAVSAPGWQCATSGRTLSCARGDSLAAGAAYPAIEFAVRVDPDTDDEELFNTARVDGGGDGNELNNEATDSGKLRRPDLAVDKVADRQIVQAGGRATFTIRVANIGTSEATNVRLTDVLPAGLTLLGITTSQGTCTPGPPIRCELGDLAVDELVTLRLTTLVGANQAGSPPLVNRVRVDLDERDPNPANNSDEASVDEVLAVADLAVTKVTATPTVPAGGDIAFKVTVTNKGLKAATNVRLQDVLPPGLTVKSASPTQGSCTTGVPITCALGNLAPGGGAQIVIIATSSPSLAGQTLTNVAEVSGDQTDGDPADNRAEAEVTLTSIPAAPATVSVTKTAAPASVIVGEEVTFTIVASNSGPGPAPNVIVTDTPKALVLIKSAEPSQGTCTTSVPVTCDLGGVPAGGRATVVIQAIPLVPGELGNGAGALAPTSGAVAVASVTAQAPPTSVRLIKRALRATVRPRGTVDFAIRVTNNGRRVARDLRICDRLPRGFSYTGLGGARMRGGQACWSVAALLPGRGRVFVLGARASSGSLPRRATNVATVSGSNFRPRSAEASVRIRSGTADPPACIARATRRC